MSETHRNTIHSSRAVPATSAEPNVTDLYGRKCRRAGTLLSQSNLMSQSSIPSSLPVVAEEKTLRDREINKYTKEYSMYLLRALQARIAFKEGQKREEEAKHCLVFLKKEYDELLKENVRLYENAKMLEVYGNSIVRLGDEAEIARELIKVLKETRFDDVLNAVACTSEATANRLNLVGLSQKDVSFAFSDRVLGFQSDLYKLLKRMESYVRQHKAVVSEISDEIRVVKQLQERNEEMKKRCSILADKLRTRTIDSNYIKYFKEAAYECKDILQEAKAQENMDNFFLANLSQNETVNLSRPCSSSTPN